MLSLLAGREGLGKPVLGYWLAAQITRGTLPDVRLALEPLVAAADQAGLAVLGLMHHNKSDSTDPLQLVMASRAFTAVARSVHTVVPDPDDDTGQRRLFGTPKNNLGRIDLPTLSYRIESFPVDTGDDLAWTGRLVWGEEKCRVDRRRHPPIRRVTRPEDRDGRGCEWLEDFLTVSRGVAASADIKKAGGRAGHSWTA